MYAELDASQVEQVADAVKRLAAPETEAAAMLAAGL